MAVPKLRAAYLDHVRTIAAETLDWSKLGPIVAKYRALIEPELEADTRKLTSLAAAVSLYLRWARPRSAPQKPASFW